MSLTSDSMPLNTDMTHTIAIAPTAMPADEMPVMMLTALCDFFEKR